MKTLILWIDAFRYDYLNEKDTPFLFSIAEQFETGKLKPVLGYTSIGASFFTGLYPNKHDQLTVYLYGNQPIRNWVLNVLPQRLGNIYFNLRRYLAHNDNFTYLIPYKYAKHFSLSQDRYYHHPNALPVKTMFDMFREKGISYLIYNWPILATDEYTKLTLTTKPNDEQRTATFTRLSKQEHDVFIMHLWDLDKYGHLYGPGSPELSVRIREQDELVKRIVNEFSLIDDNIIIWSDHGMINIDEYLDIGARLPRFGDGYVYFLDSTIARFWFFNTEKKEEVVTILHNIKHGRLLGNDDKMEFCINFDHNRYGDEIFLADPGVLLYPNFFQKRAIRGMHGYDLSDTGEWGFFLINRKTKSTGEIIDLLPTILHMMNLGVGQWDGHSLII